MSRSIPARLRRGIAAHDGISQTLYGLWLQGSVLVASALFAVVFTVLGDHVLPPLHGIRPSVLLVDTAIFVPAVLIGVVAALWPLRLGLSRLGLSPLAVVLAAPAIASVLLCIAASGLVMLWAGSMLDELLARPALTLFAMVLAALPAMLLAQEMIWPWADRRDLLPGGGHGAPVAPGRDPI